MTDACRVDGADPSFDRGAVTKRRAIVLRVATVAAVAVCLWFFVRKMQWSELGAALVDAKLWPIVLAAALNFGCLLGKAVCWRIMLAPRYVVPTSRLMRLTIAAFAGSVLAPARAGEVLRVWLLKRQDGVPVSASAATALAEKLLDGVTLVVLVAPIPWLAPELPSWVGTTILACAAIAVVAFAALYVAVGRVDDDAAGGWLARVVAGMHVLRSPRRLAAASAALVGVWLIDLAVVDLVLYAVGVDVPLGAGLIVLFGLNLAIALPSTPAQLGALEVGALAGCKLLGIADAPALAFALIYHALMVVPTLAAGLLLEHRLVLGRVPEEAARC